MTSTFKDDIAKALANGNLAGALGRFSEAYRISRARAYEGIDFEALRDRIAGIKGRAAGRLDELADEFARRAQARGAVVFRTSDPQQVKEYIAGIAERRGATRVVKSKSMATEEIHLNAFLEARGLDVRETDLGEWIIQLAGQRPSHMVMPAIHLTKEEVAEIFSKEVHERLAADIPRLVKVARKELRQRFLDADIGISGANVAVAETGTLVLMTNEGNARLCTTLPPVHVAVVGLEKLVPKLADVAPILKALPRSATSQLLTSYVSFITGPTRNPDGSTKELHVILMDNMRTTMAQDDSFREALQCIRCASCLNVCPVYRLVGGHVFGDVYAGGIGTILTAWVGAMEKTQEIQGLCVQCGSCREVCPGKIDIPELIVEIRRRLVKSQGLGAMQRGIFKVVNNRRAFHAMLRAASVAQKPFAKGGFIRHLPLFLSDLVEFRSLPAIAPKPFRDVFPSLAQNVTPGSVQKIAFFGGCLIDFAYPETGAAVVRILNRAGCEVVFPEGQTCCGAPARYSGAFDVAAQNARDNIDALLATEADVVLSACPTCTAALRHEFANALRREKDGAYISRAAELAAKTVDFSQFVSGLVRQGRVAFDDGPGAPGVTYHDSCHLRRSLGVQDEPRDLLRRSGHGITEMFESDTCCGMGGSYSLKFPEISAPILARKLANLKQTGAVLATMDCPGCVMQIRGGLDREGSPVRVRHIAELLAERLR